MVQLTSFVGWNLELQKVAAVVVEVHRPAGDARWPWVMEAAADARGESRHLKRGADVPVHINTQSMHRYNTRRQRATAQKDERQRVNANRKRGGGSVRGVDQDRVVCAAVVGVARQPAQQVSSSAAAAGQLKQWRTRQPGSAVEGGTASSTGTVQHCSTANRARRDGKELCGGTCSHKKLHDLGAGGRRHGDKVWSVDTTTRI